MADHKTVNKQIHYKVGLKVFSFSGNLIGGRMGIFSSKQELERNIKELNKKVEALSGEKEAQINEIKKLKMDVAVLTNANKEYEKKYVNTNLECSFCYTTLQKNFVYCPKCGKKIERKIQVEIENKNHNMFEIENDKDGVLITQYNGFSDKKIVIPSKINGQTVIGIWNNVFEKCTNLEEVVFQEGCKYIGKDVFTNCSNLQKVTLPKSLLEIGDGAFSKTKIIEIAIPPNVKVIGDCAFSYTHLENIILPDNLKCITADMLSNTELEKITIPESVVHIEYGAFEDSKLKEIELPQNLYSIGRFAFDIPSLKKIIIHSNVEIMEENIFGKQYGEKTIDLTICCPAGSKAQLYARKYRCNCCEIPKSLTANKEICARGLWVKFVLLKETIDLNVLCKKLSINKGETWSWKTSSSSVEINKVMSMDEAERLKKNFEWYINAYQKELFMGGVAIKDNLVEILEYW